MKLALTSLILALLLSSCSRMSEEQLWETAKQNYEQGKFKEAIENYREIVDKFKDSKEAPTAQWTIAQIYNSDLKDFRGAIGEYRKFIELYPNNERAPKAMFLMGFIYNNDLHNIDSAKIAYESYLSKYPHDELAQSAQMEIMTLGKDPSELIQPEVALKEETPKNAKKPESGKVQKKK
jgi:outer membrane assembly lipoprotein YfiO